MLALRRRQKGDYPLVSPLGSPLFRARQFRILGPKRTIYYVWPVVLSIGKSSYLRRSSATMPSREITLRSQGRRFVRVGACRFASQLEFQTHLRLPATRCARVVREFRPPK